jgi:hypothetical protein
VSPVVSMTICVAFVFSLALEALCKCCPGLNAVPFGAPHCPTDLMLFCVAGTSALRANWESANIRHRSLRNSRNHPGWGF